MGLCPDVPRQPGNAAGDVPDAANLRSRVAVVAAAGLFNNGIFSGFPIYLPGLYPTRIRATGAGFCFNIGRVLAAAGPFVTGYLVMVLHGFGLAVCAVALIYLIGLLMLPFAPETKGQPLPA